MRLCLDYVLLKKRKISPAMINKVMPRRLLLLAKVISLQVLIRVLMLRKVAVPCIRL